MNYIGNKQIQVCLTGSTEPALSVTVEWALLCGLKSLGYTDVSLEDVREILELKSVQVNESVVIDEDGKTWS